MTHSENITFPCGEETLAGTIDWNANRDKPVFMSLHGGGTATRDRVAYLTKLIAESGYSCIRFDHSGNGESTGTVRQNSLKKRLAEALAASRFMDQTLPLTVMGNSMGGAMAMELTRQLNIKNVILFCPALYAVEAFEVPFDERFTEILRSENSFFKTDTALLENFSGNFLHVISEDDTVIPKGVTELYERHIMNAASRKFIRIPGSEHQLHPFLAGNEAIREPILKDIIRLMAL